MKTLAIVLGLVLVYLAVTGKYKAVWGTLTSGATTPSQSTSASNAASQPNAGGPGMARLSPSGNSTNPGDYGGPGLLGGLAFPQLPGQGGIKGFMNVLQGRGYLHAGTDDLRLPGLGRGGPSTQPATDYGIGGNRFAQSPHFFAGPNGVGLNLRGHYGRNLFPRLGD